MLYYLAENPWPLTLVLLGIAGAFLLLLRLTQDGRNLVRALVALGVLAAFLVVEQVWVTDDERIEAVVLEMTRGLQAGDVDRVVAQFAPQVSIGQRNHVDVMEVDPVRLRETLATIEVDWLRVTRIQTTAGERTKRGTAEIRVNAAGSIGSPGSVRFNFATNASDWSIGLKKQADGAWKITRINPVTIPSFAVHAVDSYIRQIARGERPIFGRPMTGPRQGAPGRAPGLPSEWKNLGSETPVRGMPTAPVDR